MKQEAMFLEMDSRCTRCMRCVKDCHFLQEMGSPGDIAREVVEGAAAEGIPAISFLCSLCGLCNFTCPEGLSPERMFLQMRRLSREQKGRDDKMYRSLLRYEALGLSNLLSFYGLPETCDTVFFPGCAFTGTRPKVTMMLVHMLCSKIDNMGTVLSCCLKPSHDLGRERFFRKQFSGHLEVMHRRGIKNVITLCPGCHNMFTSYGEGLMMHTVYDYIDEADLPKLQADMVVHDPCAVRNERGLHERIRSLIAETGCTLNEMKHRGTHTLCCGEGGGVHYINRKMAGRWTKKITSEIDGKKVVTYCAGCHNFLDNHVDVLHLLDCLFEPHKALRGSLKPAASPFTYLNRLRLKRQLKKLYGKKA